MQMWLLLYSGVYLFWLLRFKSFLCYFSSMVLVSSIKFIQGVIPKWALVNKHRTLAKVGLLTCSLGPGSFLRSRARPASSEGPDSLIWKPLPPQVQTNLLIIHSPKINSCYHELDDTYTIFGEGKYKVMFGNNFCFKFSKTCFWKFKEKKFSFIFEIKNMFG